MLCVYCRDLDLDNAKAIPTGLRYVPGAPHHASLADLFRSAMNGCELCTLVRAKAIAIHGEGLHIGADSKIRCCLNRQSGELSWVSSSSNVYTTTEDPIAYPSPTLATLNVYTTTEDPIASVVISRPVMNVPSTDFFKLIDNWRLRCSSHKTCEKPGSHILPTRVIDVGSDHDVPRLFISQGQRGEWVTLSHCWGKGVPLKTTLQTFDQRCSGISWDSIPIMFQDAITITRRIGITYLWIDSLCIIQDSLDDWIAESAQMGSIYKNSSLTISATDSPDSRTGLFQVLNDGREHLRKQQTQLRVPCHSKKKKLRGFLFCTNEVLGMPRLPKRSILAQRAWTLQEALISRRVLLCTKSRLWWKCWGGEWAEDHPFVRHPATDALGYVGMGTNPRHRKPGSEMISRKQSSSLWSRFATTIIDVPSSHQIYMYQLRLWYLALEDLTSRSITFHSDILPAISGVAREVQKHIKKDYKAGLWLNDIQYGLTWCVQGHASRRKPYVAPSWSWASVDFLGTPLYQGLRDDMQCTWFENFRPVASIMEAVIHNINDDPFGQVVSGKIVIRAPSTTLCSCHQVWVLLDCPEPHTQWEQEGGPGKFIDAINRLSVYPNKILKWASLPDEWMCCLNTETLGLLDCSAHSQYVLLHVASYFVEKQMMYNMPREALIAVALVLERAAGQPDVYERVGIACFRESNATFERFVRTVDSWPVGTFTIV